MGYQMMQVFFIVCANGGHSTLQWHAFIFTHPQTYSGRLIQLYQDQACVSCSVFKAYCKLHRASNPLAVLCRVCPEWCNGGTNSSRLPKCKFSIAGLPYLFSSPSGWTLQRWSDANCRADLKTGIRLDDVQDIAWWFPWTDWLWHHLKTMFGLVCLMWW